MVLITTSHESIFDDISKMSVEDLETLTTAIVELNSLIHYESYPLQYARKVADHELYLRKK